MTDVLDGQVALSFVTGGTPRPDPENPTWWKALAACRGVPPQVFFPTDVKRSGPLTRRMRQAAVAEVCAGAEVEMVALAHGIEARLLRYWLTLSARQLVEPVRKTTNRPGVEAAKAICRGCSVIAECGDFALANRETDGVWGGMDPEERAVVLRRRNRRIAS